MDSTDWLAINRICLYCYLIWFHPVTQSFTCWTRLPMLFPQLTNLSTECDALFFAVYLLVNQIRKR